MEYLQGIKILKEDPDFRRDCLSPFSYIITWLTWNYHCLSAPNFEVPVYNRPAENILVKMLKLHSELWVKALVLTNFERSGTNFYHVARALKLAILAYHSLKMVYFKALATW